VIPITLFETISAEFAVSKETLLSKLRGKSNPFEIAAKHGRASTRSRQLRIRMA